MGHLQVDRKTLHGEIRYLTRMGTVANQYHVLLDPPFFFNHCLDPSPLKCRDCKGTYTNKSVKSRHKVLKVILYPQLLG